MRKLPVFILSLLLFPAIASAQSAGPPPPPPDDAPNVATARPPDPEPDAQPPAPPAPPAAPPSRARTSDDDQVGILQQRSGDGVGILQGSSDDVYRSQPAPAAAPRAAAPSGQWVYTSQYGWVWMPYGQQYVDEGTYGADTPYQYIYTARLGWAWCAAPWLWGWGAYPYFGVPGPYRFGWYRGLYRSGYGWGHYRGGYPRGGYRGGGDARNGGAYHATRPLGGGNITRGSVAPSGGGRIQGARRTYSARIGSFGGAGRVAPGGARSGGPHAVSGSRGGGHRGR
ncbi:MAG: hypothetical protein ACXWLR_09575 [Myxococcales bacterium]